MSPRMRVMVLSGALTGSVFCVALSWAAQEPGSAEDFARRGTIRHAAGDLDGAIQDFTTAIALNSNPDVRILRSAEGADRSVTIRADYSDKYMVMDRFNANACFHRGVARLQKGDLEGAIRDFDKVIAFTPRSSGALNNRGLAKHAARDLNGADDDYHGAMRLNPQNAQVHNNHGLLLCEIKDYRGAVAAYSRAIEIDPRFALAYCNRGSAYSDLGDHERAFRDCERAVELDPSLPEAYMCRGVELIYRGMDAAAENDFAHYLESGGEMKESDRTLIRKARDSRQRGK